MSITEIPKRLDFIENNEYDDIVKMLHEIINVLDVITKKAVAEN